VEIEPQSYLVPPNIHPADFFRKGGRSKKKRVMGRGSGYRVPGGHERDRGDENFSTRHQGLKGVLGGCNEEGGEAVRDGGGEVFLKMPGLK